jgi:protein-S-isoprenylcysteine O-methyltransferase Ste14
MSTPRIPYLVRLYELALALGLLALVGGAARHTVFGFLPSAIYFALEYLAIAAVPLLWFLAIHKNRFLFFWLRSPVFFTYSCLSSAFAPLRNSSGALALFTFFRYSPENTFLYRLPMNRRLLISLLYVIIVFAFGKTLYGFLTGNLNVIKNLLSVNSDTLPLESYFSIVRYAIWSAAIVGCMFGYGYSVFAPLWNRHIHNLDFTIAGWVTTSVCYPFMGFVLVALAPPLYGHNFMPSGGPWPVFVLSVELLLNILYTASILNLGTKFGVMTDKGLVSSGFYGVVRHPGYTLEVGMFLCMSLHALSSPNNWLAAMLFFVVPYYLRSEREDHFMTVSNPDFALYKQTVPYKYVPGVL